MPMLQRAQLLQIKLKIPLLQIARARQVNKDGYAKVIKKKKENQKEIGEENENK